MTGTGQPATISSKIVTLSGCTARRACVALARAKCSLVPPKVMVLASAPLNWLVVGAPSEPVPALDPAMGDDEPRPRERLENLARHREGEAGPAGGVLGGGHHAATTVRVAGSAR